MLIIQALFREAKTKHSIRRIATKEENGGIEVLPPEGQRRKR